MHANLNLCRRVYRLAESFGHAFSANVYLSLRADGWNAEGAFAVRPPCLLRPGEGLPSARASAGLRLTAPAHVPRAG